MHRFRILYLIISTALAATLFSCAANTLNGYTKAEKSIEVFHAPYFSDLATDYVYKANISVYGREFGGLFIAKKISDDTHRVAFTTGFGNKLFDFEISSTEFKVNYILEELDRKIITNTLRDDFRLLLKAFHPIVDQYDNENHTAYTSHTGNRYNYLFVDKKTDMLVKMIHATAGKEKIIISYSAKNNTLAQNIVIDHKDIKLKIELNYIND